MKATVPGHPARKRCQDLTQAQLFPQKPLRGNTPGAPTQLPGVPVVLPQFSPHGLQPETFVGQMSTAPCCLTQSVDTLARHAAPW